ncbi:MAG: amidohydrolase family protein [Pseudohongiellaceae bacterium]
MRKLFTLIPLFACLLGANTAHSAELTAPVADHFLSLRSQAAADVSLLLNRASPNPRSSNRNSKGDPVTAGQALNALDQASIQKALVISSAYLFSAPELNPSGEQSLVKRENDFLAQQVAVNPRRLTGVCSLNPLSDFALDEAQRCAQRLELKALYLNFYSSGINLRSSRHISKLKELFQFLEVLEFPVLMQIRTRNETYGSVDVKLLIDNVLSEAPSLDMHITQLGSNGVYDYAADRVMGEFLEAFEDGRLEPSRLQFDLADTISMEYNSMSPSEIRLAGERNELLLNRIRQLDIQQLLFASNWPAPLAPAFTSLGQIPQRISDWRRHLGLSSEEWSNLFQAQSRLFD